MKIKKLFKNFISLLLILSLIIQPVYASLLFQPINSSNAADKIGTSSTLSNLSSNGTLNEAINGLIQAGAEASVNTAVNGGSLEKNLTQSILSSHPQNQTKATWFNQALGFDQNNWKKLAKQLYFDPKKATLTKINQYGKTYEQIIPIVGTNGKTIETAFVFMKDNSGIVKFITGIPSRR